MATPGYKIEAITQDEVYVLISDINTFADRAEGLIASTQNACEDEKKRLLNRHGAALMNLEKTYMANRSAILSKSDQMINDARNILSEIHRLDDKLSGVDKYYVKTKNKKEEELSGKKSELFDSSADYFNTLENIKAAYQVLISKYSEDILPALFNGLNYLFSSQRKKDYEDLIVLKNTVKAFLKEIESVLPQVTEENLAALKEEYFTQRGALQAQQRMELSDLEARCGKSMDATADEICSLLDNILPDDFVSYLQSLMRYYNTSLLKVTSAHDIKNGILNMCFVDYPVDFFIQSKIVASLIKDKCAKIIVGDSIRLPLAATIKDAPVWLIRNDNNHVSALQALMQSIMFGFLSSCPVSELAYIVIDPENRGNSVFPYFDAKKKLSELFGDKIYVSKEDIVAKVHAINDYIEDILQNKLGTRFENIYDYAADNPEYEVTTQLLMLFDFPNGLDEYGLSGLRNILRNGRRCGIFAVISYTPVSENCSNEILQSIRTVESLATVLQQNKQDFILRGLPIIYQPMPDKMEFFKFFSRYMLIFEGIKNRGIVFPPWIRKLIEASDSVELDDHISGICRIMNGYKETYAKVPPEDAPFQPSMVLGRTRYPSDIFSDSITFEKIMKTFGSGKNGSVELPSVELPLLFDLQNSFNLFLHCSESTTQMITAFSHHVIWSFFSFAPVSKVNICVFDNEQRGNSILPFLEFRKKVPEAFDQKIHTDSEAMFEKILDLNRQIDEFVQEKLGNRFHNIVEYNLNTPNRAEVITLLVVYDFPGGFDSRSLNLLTNILRNGNKCGVYTLICYNSNITYSRYESIDERLEKIKKFCTELDYKDGSYMLLPFNLPVDIPEQLGYEKINSFVNQYAEVSEIIKKKGLSFSDIISRDMFSGDSSKSLNIPIGIGDGDAIVRLTLGEGSSHHGLITGATGSGKSTLLHTLIMSSMLQYSPDQLHLYLMDFKSGTEFKIYESVHLPHIQLLALDAMQEFGESILEKLVGEMERRGGLFKSAGQTSLEGYTRETGKPMPRILVIMDEFQILFNDASNRKVAMNCAELTKRIVTEGRAFGIHLLMATQTTKVISDLTLTHGTLEQMRIRIGLKCGEDDARYLFSDRNDSKALSMMKGPIGTAVMNPEYMESANIGLRIAYCDAKTQAHYLGVISEKFQDTPSMLRIFEGSRTIGLLDYFSQKSIGLTDELPVRIHMGALIKVAPPFEIMIDGKRRHNMLVCGANERMSNNLVNIYMVSALLNSHSTVICIDGDMLVGDSASQPLYNLFGRFGKRFMMAHNRADIVTLVNEAYEKYTGKKKENTKEQVFVVIKNLQFLDTVKAMFKGEHVDVDSGLFDDGDPNDPFASLNNFISSRDSKGASLNVSEKMQRLIDDGSAYGIHFVVSSSEYQSVRESMYFGENILSKFPERIIFSLNNNDSDNLIDNVSVASLSDNTVYYTDGVKNTFQLKPYVMPQLNNLKTFLKNENIFGE